MCSKRGRDIMKKLFMKKENKGFLCLSTVLIICFLALCSLLFYSNTVNAKEPSNSIKQYTSIYIEPGDTLTSIAKEYQTEEYSNLLEYIEEIKYVNNLHSDKITAGCYLLIPHYVEKSK